MTDKLNLDELQKLCDAATPGPWERDGDARTVDEDGEYGQEWVQCDIGYRWYSTHPLAGDEYARQCIDAEFIATAREAMPALIARVRELENKLKHAQDNIAGLIYNSANKPDVLERIHSGVRTLLADSEVK
jgi:hypothetical protein